MKSLVAVLMLLPAAYGQKSGKVEDGIQLALPFKTWGVRIDSPGAVVDRREMKSGRQAYILSSNPKNGIVISITIENVGQIPEPAECNRYLGQMKDSYSTASAPRLRHEPYGEVLELLLDRGEFATINQKNVFACLTRGSAVIDVHLSKAGFVPADQAAMEEALRSIRFIAADPAIAPAVQSSADLMAEGNRRFVAGDYKAAIGPYESALELEELKQRLPRDLWRVLVDNLGMSFGLVGDLDAAEGVFRFGISKDSTYAIFHYNLACARAEKKDLAGAMEELRVAFRNRDTMIKGEAMPDPSKDESFAPFLNNAEFARFLKDLR
jgi:tetratricopeptide (TPR) repeat protein